MDWPLAETIQYWSGLAALFALPLGICAIVYAARQLSLARKAGSGASLMALSETFRQNWNAFLAAPGESERRHAFADLANALEIACAVFRDGVFFGNSKDVLEYYLVGVFRLIQDSEFARTHLTTLLQTRETFQNIRFFVAGHKATINSPALAAPSSADHEAA
ncbi:hypothetical protein [Bradyrhizobium sp. dw_411]|uniref:hypothetical protein n=1 Tax=Bradyrhizobium sp. dw_411 TaxID=2720082 RepID=UPI001BCE666F|nr:hypothetical protein [Bradyrhizobium sp. dw_411]